MSSIKSLCMSVIFLPESCSSSSIEPTTLISYSSSEIQIGIGLPQSLFLDTHQSLTSESQLWNLPSCTSLGTHLDFLLLAMSYSLRSVTLMNQDLKVLYIKGESVLQQCG